MLEIYWACLIGGVLFALVTVVLGDVISHVFDGLFDFLSVDILQPMVVVGAITGFGGAGVVLSEYSSLGAGPIALLSALFAVLLAVVLYFGYVKPMRNSENSIGYSMRDLAGKIGEVTVPIAGKGYGEVLIRVGAVNTNQLAASFEGEEIRAGERVVVVEIRDNILYVSRFDADVEQQQL